jgi:cytochrome P450
LTSYHIPPLSTCTSQNPDGFDPDRWAPGAIDEEKLKELFTPFALGKRNCVGQNLAKLELKLVLATLYKSFSFELVSEVSVDYFLTIKPANAHMKVQAGKC